MLALCCCLLGVAGGILNFNAPPLSEWAPPKLKPKVGEVYSIIITNRPLGAYGGKFSVHSASAHITAALPLDQDLEIRSKTEGNWKADTLWVDPERPMLRTPDIYLQVVLPNDPRLAGMNATLTASALISYPAFHFPDLPKMPDLSKKGIVQSSSQFDPPRLKYDTIEVTFRSEETITFESQRDRDEVEALRRAFNRPPSFVLLSRVLMASSAVGIVLLAFLYRRFHSGR